METHTFTAVHPSDLPKTPAMPKAMLERRHEKGRQRRVDVLSRRLGTYTGSGVSKKKKKKKSKAKERERLRRSTANGHASSAMCNIYDEQGRHLTCWVGYFPDVRFSLFVLIYRHTKRMADVYAHTDMYTRRPSHHIQRIGVPSPSCPFSSLY
ncbi:hypothetical protein SAICODRAFT_196201 [Saitoella complicata NRRL Y-17804]|uniref:uncharacterized protein n=1 Tax=Saitoella complicata (strain BCRC 22490 / CBS 7301 / JCM 7358 / NBRC 10748 / NRRL Y-17804) TaxID=698492 RepID=UPI000867A2C0|nr:uncharacterized protein SAICODRAFT_196201 [Saitoella complicata NRRL Y-17804]ODQ54904.1 hypothetical protein SAICODRAFT_196201 [Saitoella complicata NRRL Y-17804]